LYLTMEVKGFSNAQHLTFQDLLARDIITVGHIKFRPEIKSLT